MTSLVSALFSLLSRVNCENSFGMTALRRGSVWQKQDRATGVIFLSETAHFVWGKWVMAISRLLMLDTGRQC
jgi:hypothetical protein